jgi:hypothetical protein
MNDYGKSRQLLNEALLSIKSEEKGQSVSKERK